MPAFLSSPEVAFALLAVAVVGIVLEVAVPGVGLGAIVAAGLIALSAWALAALEPRPLGVALMLLSAALLVAGVFLRGRPWWSAAGGVALFVGGLTLFARAPDLWVVLAVSAIVPVAAAVLGRLVARVWDSPPHRGVAGTLVGLQGEVRDGAAPGEEARVLIAGALWRARADVALAAGMRVVVEEQRDLELRVRPARDAAKADRT